MVVVTAASAASLLSRASLNTATVKGADLPAAVEAAAAAGFAAVGLWRDRVKEVGTARAGAVVAQAGLRVSSLCRGGFLTGTAADETRRAVEDNHRAIEEAAALGTRELVMVVGGLPAGDKDLVGARERVADRLAELAPVAREHGVRMALEALHPMFAADRAVVSTLDQALDLAAPHPADVVGVVVDTYHVWWDPALTRAIVRAGTEGRIASYQVCDWVLPLAADPLLSRGHVGDGCIDFAAITKLVAAAGYAGDVETEIFNQEIWDAPVADVAKIVADRYLHHVHPHLGTA